MTPVAFVRGAKTLLLLKLDGEASYGFRDRLKRGHDDRAVFEVTDVGALSPATRAGVSEGDELLSVRVLGVDADPFAWSDSALERIEQLDEISIVQICVKKKDDARTTEAQQRRHDYISQWLTKAKMLKIASKRFRGGFNVAQLQKVVVLMYDFEFECFANLWKALLPHERERMALPVARGFVSETKLPGLVDETRRVVQTPTPSTRSPCMKASDMGTTESEVYSLRSPSLPRTKSEHSASTPREEGEADDSTSISSYQDDPRDRYLPYGHAQRTPTTFGHRTLSTSKYRKRTSSRASHAIHV